MGKAAKAARGSDRRSHSVSGRNADGHAFTADADDRYRSRLVHGQSPFYVLLQQGGQLKDLFGGIGPAIKAVVAMSPASSRCLPRRPRVQSP